MQGGIFKKPMNKLKYNSKNIQIIQKKASLGNWWW